MRAFFQLLYFFKAEKGIFFSKTCALVLQKQLLTNEIKICSSYIYCALSATSKFNFEPLFDFIKFFREYLKQLTQNSLNTYEFSFLHFHSNSGRLNLLGFCESTLEVHAIATGGYLDAYSLGTGELTDLNNRRK